VLAISTKSPPPDTVARELLRFEWRLVTATDYLQRGPAIEEPEDLLTARAIMFSQAWLQARFRHRRSHSLRSVALNRYLIVNRNEAALNATLHGAGVGLVPGYLSDELLRTGRLQAVLPD
jgi:DNA-binding transcriptional LysR family regulator